MASSQSPSQGQQPGHQAEQPKESAAAAPGNALPAPGSSENVTTLDVSGGGTTVKLDALGPLVVNQDGTMSRISNWAEMADIEKENTLRILGKRNKSRLAALKKAQGIDEEQAGNS